MVKCSAHVIQQSVHAQSLQPELVDREPEVLLRMHSWIRGWTDSVELVAAMELILRRHYAVVERCAPTCQSARVPMSAWPDPKHLVQ
eukprot:SAG31_NODE_2431_length_5707_cov_2.157810_6_plen_87_part_00